MKTIHIPKIEGDRNTTFPVKFYRSKSRKYSIYLQKQNIVGLDIPKDTEINIEWEIYYLSTQCVHHCPEEIHIPVYYINRMLKFVYLEKLRNKL